MPNYTHQNTLAYLSDLECPSRITTSVVNRIAEFISITNIEPEFMFLEDIINDDGRREFIGVILLTKGTWSEVSLSSDATLWTNAIHRGIWHLSLNERTAINGTDVNDSSRLSIHVVFANGNDATLSATGLNCKELIKVYQEYLMPILMENQLVAGPAVRTRGHGRGKPVSE